MEAAADVGWWWAVLRLLPLGVVAAVAALVLCTAWNWRRAQGLLESIEAQPSDWHCPTPAELATLQRRGDPLCDACFAGLSPRLHPFRCEAELRKLRPHAWRALDAQLERVPAWVDPALLDVGRSVYRRHALAGTLAGFEALVESYAYCPGNRVLLITNRLSNERAGTVVRRLSETARMFMDVAVHGVLPGQRGHRSVVAVRRLHSWVRNMVYSTPERAAQWKGEEWGCVANQEDMAHTIILNSHCYIRGLLRLGAPLTAREVEAFHHLFRTVGHFIGCALDVPRYTDELRLYRAINRRSRRPTDDVARLLAQRTLAAVAATSMSESLSRAVLEHLMETDEPGLAAGLRCGVGGRQLGPAPKRQRLLLAALRLGRGPYALYKTLERWVPPLERCATAAALRHVEAQVARWAGPRHPFNIS